MTACAKGRIERAWGTLQSRLTSELRLAEALTLADAQRVLESYLPRFNERFMVPAAQPGSAYRPVPADFVAEEVFCFKYGRTVAADNTVRFEEHRLQLLAGRERPSYARAHVERCRSAWTAAWRCITRDAGSPISRLRPKRPFCAPVVAHGPSSPVQPLSRRRHSRPKRRLTPPPAHHHRPPERGPPMTIPGSAL